MSSLPRLQCSSTIFDSGIVVLPLTALGPTLWFTCATLKLISAHHLPLATSTTKFLIKPTPWNLSLTKSPNVFLKLSRLLNLKFLHQIRSNRLSTKPMRYNNAKSLSRLAKLRFNSKWLRCSP